MNTYIVKNIDDYPMLLEFQDNSRIKLRPGGLYVWQGPDENVDFLQDYVDAGKLSVWTFETDFTSQQLEKSPEILFDWLKEGF